MDYPINDVFEGVGDLLKAHGVVELSTHNLDEGQTDIYVKYGGYNYLAIYIDGVLHSIKRTEEVNNGQDQG